jgi:hypothetical protein
MLLLLKTNKECRRRLENFLSSRPQSTIHLKRAHLVRDLEVSTR